MAFLLAGIADGFAFLQKLDPTLRPPYDDCLTLHQSNGVLEGQTQASHQFGSAASIPPDFDVVGYDARNSRELKCAGHLSSLNPLRNAQ